MRSRNWIREIKIEYCSLERYVEYMYNHGADPLILGYTPFKYFLEKGLLKKDDIIRTNIEGGNRDGHYRITSKGELEGVEAAGGTYSGNPRIHNPKRILSLKRADHGWTLSRRAKVRIVTSLEKI